MTLETGEPASLKQSAEGNLAMPRRPFPSPETHGCFAKKNWKSESEMNGQIECRGLK